MHGASYEYTYEQGYPAVVNHPAETSHLVSTAKNTEGVQQVIDGEPQMGGEDFAYYLQNVKGTFSLQVPLPNSQIEFIPTTIRNLISTKSHADSGQGPCRRCDHLSSAIKKQPECLFSGCFL